MKTRATVRRYAEADKDPVWEVHDRALRDSAMAFSPEYNRYLRHVEREFLDVGGEFLVAAVGSRTDDGAGSAGSERLVAIGGYQPLSQLGDTPAALGVPALDVPVRDTVRMRSVAVLPEFQSAGIGTALVSALEERADESGFDAVVLKTTTSLARARRFYESSGYRALSEPERAESGAEYVWYRKRL